MNRMNLWCEADNCGNPAKVFGMKGNQKTRSCGDHIPSLVDKGMQIFSIAGYDFIETLRDVEEFAARSAKVEKGRGNLAVLEAGCAAELESAIRTIHTTKSLVIQAVECRFEEMKMAATEACADAKAQISKVQNELELFLYSKQNVLSPTAEVVCEEMKVAPVILKLMIKDSADSVSALLSSSWRVCIKDICSTLKCLKGQDEENTLKAALEEAAQFGQKGFPEALWYVHLLAQSSSYYQTKALLELLKFLKEQNEQNFIWLRSSWDLRQRQSIFDRGTIEVGQKLANVLCYQHGQFAEAERMLRTCYSALQDPLSEISMSLCNDICSVYFASVQYQLLQPFGAWVLDTFGNANLPAQLYWTTLFYLTYSLKWDNKHAEANQLLERWRTRDLGREDKLTEMLRLLTSGIEAFFELKYRAAVGHLEKALNIGKCHFPTSIFTALGFCHLARTAEREGYYRKAQRIYEVAAPKSAHAAINLNFLGNLLRKKKSLDKSEECLRQAGAILDVAVPKSVAAGNNSLHMAQLFEARGNSQQALQYYQKAASIYAENGALEKIDADEAIARLLSR